MNVDYKFGIFQEDFKINDELNFDLHYNFNSKLNVFKSETIWPITDALSAFYVMCNPDSVKVAENSFKQILGEILENIVKYSSTTKQSNSLSFYDYKDSYVIEVSNVATEKQSKGLIDHLQRFKDLKKEELEAFYIKLMEESFEVENQSKTGLVMILKDHDSKLGVKITQDENDSEHYHVITKIFVKK